MGFLVSKREDNSVEGHKRREWKPLWYLFWFRHPRTIFICLSLLCLIHFSISKFVYDVTTFFFLSMKICFHEYDAFYFYFGNLIYAILFLFVCVGILVLCFHVDMHGLA